MDNATNTTDVTDLDDLALDVLIVTRLVQVAATAIALGAFTLAGTAEYMIQVRAIRMPFASWIEVKVCGGPPSIHDRRGYRAAVNTHAELNEAVGSRVSIHALPTEEHAREYRRC